MGWEFQRGKKTFVAAAALIVAGLLQGNTEMVLEGLALVGLRLAIG